MEYLKTFSQDLNHVAELDFGELPLLCIDSCHVHQAGTVGTCYEFSTSGGMSSQFALAHLLADGKAPRC